MQPWHIFLLASGIQAACFAQASDSLAPGVKLAELTYYDSDLGKTVAATAEAENLPLIELAADKRFLFLTFESENGLHSRHLEIAYQLTPVEKVWHQLAGKPFLIIADLPAGKYDLLVMARTNPGSWSAPWRIPLHVSGSFFWQNGYYALFFFVAPLLFSIWFFRHRSCFRQLEPSLPTELIGQQKSNTWLSKLEAAVQTALSGNRSITAQYLARELALSERQLLRRVQAETGMSVRAYLQEMKLQEAKRLLETRNYSTIAEVAFAVGFNTPGYFTKTYVKRFGQHPRELLNRY